ncbi:hypothetical protein AC1031_007621 [Aphanomyces cochlioides]|nr:hypothetical protein AC1031_007621 [Aphanomyces cochlioides]
MQSCEERVQRLRRRFNDNRVEISVRGSMRAAMLSLRRTPHEGQSRGSGLEEQWRIHFRLLCSSEVDKSLDPVYVVETVAETIDNLVQHQQSSHAKRSLMD